MCVIRLVLLYCIVYRLAHVGVHGEDATDLCCPVRSANDQIILILNISVPSSC